jgi:hypothetical protein
MSDQTRSTTKPGADSRDRLKSLLARRKAQADSTYPASSTQQRAWFLSQLRPDSAFYNVPVAFRISGAFEINRLRDALRRVVERHEALRTTFVTVNESLVQWVSTSTSASAMAPLIDLSALSLPVRASQPRSASAV